MDALHRSLSTAVEIAAMAVVVDAKDDEAEAFYDTSIFVRFRNNLGGYFCR